MSKKDKISLGVRQEFDDIDYWHKLDKVKPAHQLKDGTWLTEYEFMKKFMHEAYGGNFDRKDDSGNILQTKEQKSWAIRNNNNTNRDTLNVIKKSNKWMQLIQERNNDTEITSEEPWVKTFTLENYESAFEELSDYTVSSLNLTSDQLTGLDIIRIYFRVKRFLSLVRKDRKNKMKKCKQCKKTKDRSQFYKHGQTKDKIMNKCKECTRSKNVKNN